MKTAIFRNIITISNNLSIGLYLKMQFILVMTKAEFSAAITYLYICLFKKITKYYVKAFPF